MSLTRLSTGNLSQRIEQYVEGKILRDEDSKNIYRMMREKAICDLSYNVDPSGQLGEYKYYSKFVNDLNASLQKLDLRSRGLRDFGAYLSAYCASEQLRDMTAWRQRIRENVGVRGGDGVRDSAQAAEGES